MARSKYVVLTIHKQQQYSLQPTDPNPVFLILKWQTGRATVGIQARVNGNQCDSRTVSRTANTELNVGWKVVPGACRGTKMSPRQQPTELRWWNVLRRCGRLTERVVENISNWFSSGALLASVAPPWLRWTDWGISRREVGGGGGGAHWCNNVYICKKKKRYIYI